VKAVKLGGRELTSWPPLMALGDIDAAMEESDICNDDIKIISSV